MLSHKLPRSAGLTGQRGFTLVEIMIVVAIISLLMAIAMPNYLRSRKRAQANAIRTDLRTIDSAVDQYALENGLPENTVVRLDAWKMYVKPGSRLYTTGADIYGNAFGDQKVGALPVVPAASYDTLVDVADSTFWAPYVKGN